MTLKERLEKNEKLKPLLFKSGYLITTKSDIDYNGYPFYRAWGVTTVGEYCICTHPAAPLFLYNGAEWDYFMIGHAVDPVFDLIDEAEMLRAIAECSPNLANDRLNSLTGNFIVGRICGRKLEFVTDPAGMLFCSYGCILGEVYVSSHPQLVADLLGLEKSEYACKLENYKHFYKYGVFFPGDITQFSELNRALQNHITCFDGKFSVKRFYPTRELDICKTEEEYSSVVKQSADMLKKTLELASKKWDSIAISMTGGMDSKTTLACANGVYDRFTYYSYVSMHGDKIDADAAHKIADHIGIDHVIYNISEDDADFEEIDDIKHILSHNKGGYRTNPNDARKRCYFLNDSSFEVEVKSWVSEIARANYYKKFGKKKMPKHLSARNMSSMYKVFTIQRGLLSKTDKIFKDYIKKTGFNNLPNGYDESDMYLWEFRYSAWGGMVITMEHSFTNLIFIPYNNRLLLDTMLRAPLEKRISDTLHEDIIRRANEKVDELGITVTNWNETKKRQLMEKTYFAINSHLPF